jgi:excisionase family DNA binding protein
MMNGNATNHGNWPRNDWMNTNPKLTAMIEYRTVQITLMVPGEGVHEGLERASYHVRKFIGYSFGANGLSYTSQDSAMTVSKEANMSTPPVAISPVPIDPKLVEAVVDKLRPTLREAVAEGIKGLTLQTLVSPQSEVGVELTEIDRQKAKSVKEELLQSKRALDDRLLIDVGTVAHLLSVSRGTVYRLSCSGAMPPSIKMPGRLARWRADEMKAWVDADCPMMRDWRWPEATVTPFKGRSVRR